MKDVVWSVRGLLEAVNGLLDQGFSNVRVEGEVSNVSRSARGHVYFSLKEEGAQVDCVMWASAARRLRFEAEDGLAVLATGSLTIYAARGRFQMVLSALEPQGVGALQLAFEQVKKRLAAEGLFDEDRRRPLPSLPQRVGIVTSATGAALRDMVKVLRRHPNIEVVVAAAQVQGDGAAAQISHALRSLAASGRVDVVIVGRGGGSLEDLWAFNEEELVRAIADCEVPVISGVGHETDFTLADLAADVRAATPTQAAELLVARLEAQERRIVEAGRRLDRDLSRHLRTARARFTALVGSAGLARLPAQVRLARSRLEAADRLPMLLRGLEQRTRSRLERAAAALQRFPSRVAAGGHRRLLDSHSHLLASLLGARLKSAGAELDARERALQHLSPRRVLERGYSITTLEGCSEPLRRPEAAAAGVTLHTTLARGELRSLVIRGRAAKTRNSGRRCRDTADQPSLFEDGGES